MDAPNTSSSPSTTAVQVRKLMGSHGGEDGYTMSGLDKDSSRNSSRMGSSEEREIMEYCGWVYHLGTNSIGHEFCHLRFLRVCGKHVFMYKRDPQLNLGIAPIRKGTVALTFMVEDLGRRKVNDGELFVIRFYNRLDETKKGEIACGSAGAAQTWIDAFDKAKLHAEFELSSGSSSKTVLNMETEINLEGHRPRVRRYARELRKLIRIGQGPEALIRQSSSLSYKFKSETSGDAIETNEWRCVRIIQGVRIFEDASDPRNGKGVIVKAVTTINAPSDSVFDVLLNIERRQRHEWDMLTPDLELIDSYDGHYDVIYGTYDPNYLNRWHSRRDFVFSRQWFRSQDGTYTILQYPAVHKKRPPISGYRRTSIYPSIWEIKSLSSPTHSNSSRSLVTLMLEIHELGWCRWKNYSYTKLEKSIPYGLLSQLPGLKEYIEANPSFTIEASSIVVDTKLSEGFVSEVATVDTEEDQFYDAITAEDSSSSSEEEEREGGKRAKQNASVKLRNVSWAIASLTVKHNKEMDVNMQLDSSVPRLAIDPSRFHTSLLKARHDNDSNCWSMPSGMGFMIRGKNYLKDYSKVIGGEPLLELIGVDWFKVRSPVDRIALHSMSLLQTEYGKCLPFVLVINLQIPANPNYSLVLYYASDRPVIKNSLLGEFVDGTDSFRNSRFKLIPSIIEGYWMVKRAVGTKACLLGKAVTCNYFRENNFLEIDVDIGSSSVARSIIGIVLGYVTSLVVDLAILVEAKEETELPECILGTVRLNHVRLETAVTLDV